MSSSEARATEPSGLSAGRAVGALRQTALQAYRNPELRRTAPLIIAIVAVGIYASSASDTFLTLHNFQNIFGQISVFGILCVGSTLLLIAGKIDLSIGSAVSLISVLGGKLLIESGASELTVAAAMIALGVAIGLLIGLIIVTTRVQPFILTLGGLSVFSALALIVSHSRPIATGLSFSSMAIDQVGPIPDSAFIFLVAAVIGAAILRYTTLGRRTYAIGSNEEAAFLAGVPTRLTTVVLYSFNGALVGLAALILLARIGSGDPKAGIGLELQVITAVVLGGATLTGGRGTMFGTFLGVFLLGIISNALQIAGVSSAYAELVFGAILIIAVVWAALRERGSLLERLRFRRRGAD